MSSTNYEADLLDLVREAYVAQEGFDNWDGGETHYPGPFGKPNRECDLATVIQEMDEANLTLVMYIAENHEAIIEAIMKRAGERANETEREG